MKSGWKRSALGCALLLGTIGCGTSRQQVSQTSESERLLGIAQLFEQQGRSDFAENLYVKVLTSEPRNPQAMASLARLTGADRKAAEESETILASQNRQAATIASASVESTAADSDSLQLAGNQVQAKPAPQSESRAIHEPSTEVPVATKIAPAPPEFDADVEIKETLITDEDAPLPVEPQIVELADPDPETEVDIADLPIIELLEDDNPVAEPVNPTAPNATAVVDEAIAESSERIADDSVAVSDDKQPSPEPSWDEIDSLLAEETASSSPEPAAALSPEMQGLIDRMQDADRGTQLIAIIDLGELGTEALPIVDRLSLRLSEENDPMVRIILAEAIAKINPADNTVAETITDALNGSDERQQQLAILAVSRLIDRLVESGSTDSDALLKQLAPAVRPSLARAMGHDESVIRHAARASFETIESI